MSIDVSIAAVATHTRVATPTNPFPGDECVRILSESPETACVQVRGTYGVRSAFSSASLNLIQLRSLIAALGQEELRLASLARQARTAKLLKAAKS